MSADTGATAEMASISLSLRPVPESSRHARRFVASVLAGDRWDTVRETAILLTSELVTNALLHTASTAEITVSLADDVTISVRDADTGPLFSRAPTGELAEGGRGMLLVNQMSDRWGTEHSRGRKTVWFSLSPSVDEAHSMPDGPSDPVATERDVPPAVVSDRRLSALMLDLELEAYLSPREQVAEILQRAVTALNASGAVLRPDSGAGDPVTVGTAEGLSNHQRLQVGGESPGYLTVFSDRELDEEEEAFLRLAAQRLALSLASNRLLDAARKRHADMELLAEATELLAGSTSIAHVLSLSVQVVVPDLADWAVAYVVDVRARARRVTAMHSDESRVDSVLAFLDSDPDFGSTLTAAAHSGEMARFIRPVTFDGVTFQVLVVPLLSRGQTSGLLVLGQPEPLEATDHLAILELSRRVGLALDNANLHEQVAAAATALHESLVPSSLPGLNELELGARYFAATPTVSVGGDFFDVFQLQDGSVILIIGDVCGKGPAAAALARTSRDVLRLLLHDGWSAVEALRRLNVALQSESHQERFVTVAVAGYQPGATDGVLRVCLAGHPPPLLVRKSGYAEPLGKPGGLIGLLPDDALTLEEVEYSVEFGESVVLYTDGVTEARRGSELFGMDGLVEVLDGTGSTSAQWLADSVHDAAAKFGANSLRDDMAVLVAKALPGSRP
jgi:serine phosphatase RsbU (regulator of sigma subunit)/anti-sigma regulatory factor (Ser/Thr protein kinase)